MVWFFSFLYLIVTLTMYQLIALLMVVIGSIMIFVFAVIREFKKSLDNLFKL